MTEVWTVNSTSWGDEYGIPMFYGLPKQLTAAEVLSRSHMHRSFHALHTVSAQFQTETDAITMKEAKRKEVE